MLLSSGVAAVKNSIDKGLDKFKETVSGKGKKASFNKIQVTEVTHGQNTSNETLMFEKRWELIPRGKVAKRVGDETKYVDFDDPELCHNSRSPGRSHPVGGILLFYPLIRRPYS
jgi:hypothetical protein